MNTIEIGQALQRNKLTRKYFQGVFPSDQLPKKRISQRPAIFIVNSDPSYRSGQHWLAIFLDDLNNAEYFDSYGTQPLNIAIKNFLKRNSKNFKINYQQVQGYFSTTCGHYCMLYSLYKSQNKSLKLFLNQFKKNDYNYNDRKVVDQCKKKFFL